MTGDILSVAIRPDGWSAEITIEGLLKGGSYSLGLGTNYDPDTGTPKIVFTVVSKGFDATGAATTITRTVYGTYQVRKPWPSNAENDEVESGGNVTVRVALSDYIFQKDATGAGNSGTAPTVHILGGFYQQGGTDNLPTSAGFPVTNNSTCAYQKPIGNWSMAPFQRIEGTFDLRAVAFHHGAKNGKPVACVKFSVSDGTNTVNPTAVTAMTLDADMNGDAKPAAEYVASVDPTTLTDKTVVYANFIAYPWIGDEVLDTSTGATAPTPLPGPMPMLNDRGGTYGVTYAVVDPVGGTDPASVSDDTGKWVGNGALHGSGSGVTAFATIARAARAIRNYNAARSPSRDDVGAGIIYLKAGNYSWLGATISGGYGSVPATWLTVKPYTGVSRASIVINATSGNTDISDRIKVEGVTITSATNGTFSGILAQWFHGCEFNTTGTGIFNTAGGVAWFTQNKLTLLTQGLRPSSSGTNWTPALVRGNTFEGFNRTILAYTVMANANLQKTTWAATMILGRLGTSAQPIGPCIVYNNDLRGWKPTSSTQMLVIGNEDMALSDIAIVQNLFESTTDAVAGIATFAASEGILGNTPISNVIWWHNVLVGQRIQFAYNTAGGIAKERKFWSVKNSYFDVSGCKSDTHNDPGENTAHIGNWPVRFGVSHSGNVSASVTAITGPFIRDYIGISSIENTAAMSTTASWAGFTNRLSHAGGGVEAAGMGDYTLTSGSPIRDLVQDWVLPYDLDGDPRSATDSPGVYTTYVAPVDPGPGAGNIVAGSVIAGTVTIGNP